MIFKLSFEQLVIYSSFLSLIPLIAFTLYRLVKKQYQAVISRHIAGFFIGMLDQIFMIWFGWQPTIIPIVILFNYGLYGTWFLFMPLWEKINHKKIWILLWIIFSGVFNTTLENVVRIYTYGNLNYPEGWSQLYTLIFYLCMHLIGTFISSSPLIIKNISQKPNI
ncbi:MAG: hypothetical protein GF329_18270 [Candidatus Lokiarchaeota archaeon]|nr:hypothetical protein [Candidatus Lokiarchaeota archaeon]